MIRSPFFGIAPAVLLVAGCANSGANYKPVVDGPVGPAYEADLAACQSLAASSPTVDGNTAGSAATGAAVAGASSVIWNGNSDNLAEAAAVGLIAGITGDAVQKNKQRESVVKNCMRGRGHNVVG
ncbi:glycine zipper family protein [Primorskyibacter sp. S87]|uniref:glycine zipper family protein n=1 Tax=Primorskyibacter sp. S87 TaxID=3415126 RepID=UPI003C7D76A8